MEMEIKVELGLTSTQSAMLDIHSYLNTMNVLISELLTLEEAFGNHNGFRTLINDCFQRVNKLSESDRGLDYDAENIENEVLAALNEASRYQPHIFERPEVLESVENVENVLSVLKVRGRELAARHHIPLVWTDQDTEEIRYDLVHFLASVEKNSKGRFRIVYDIAEKGETDYMVDIAISSVDGNAVRIPMILRDIMRDLVANARKYTDPGGRISAGLVDNGENIRLVVEDTGRGIPADQISSVVYFGVRASNVSSRETKGGGFGLTKAYFVTRQLGGRMWIRSIIDKGTRITIQIPRQHKSA
jgi:signal transduction histidine kinase